VATEIPGYVSSSLRRSARATRRELALGRAAGGPSSEPELLNLQDVKGEAKPYQARQLLHLIERYDLHLGEDV